MTNTPDLAIVAAFIDGERVDPVALKQALASDEGRDYLVDLVAMREVMATPAAAVATTIAASAPTATSRWSMRGLAAAAAVTLAVGVGSYVLGNLAAERRIVAQQEAANKAPTPTREIAPDSSTSWIETSGGNH